MTFFLRLLRNLVNNYIFDTNVRSFVHWAWEKAVVGKIKNKGNKPKITF